MITYYVRPAIRDQFAEMIRSVCPDAKPVEYAHESDMGGANVTPAALHRYFNTITVDNRFAALAMTRCGWSGARLALATGEAPTRGSRCTVSMVSTNSR